MTEEDHTEAMARTLEEVARALDINLEGTTDVVGGGARILCEIGRLKGPARERTTLVQVEGLWGAISFGVFLWWLLA